MVNLPGMEGIMKRSVPVTLVFLLALLVGTSYAVEGTWFGPIRYQRTEKRPNLYADTFPGLPGQGTLVIKNGGGDEKHRLSSALILVNGEQILGPSDFNQQIHGKASSIRLAGNNSIIVETRGEPGSYLTVQVVQEIGWLFFHEGDPGIPGDGESVDGVPVADPSFDLVTPISLGQFEDGFTATIFSPIEAQIDKLVFNPIVTTIGYEPSDGCWFGFGAGLYFTGVTSFNDVQGFFVNVSDSLIQEWVDFSNESRPGCNLTPDDLFLVGFAIRELDGTVALPTLDAAVILYGQNALP